MLLAIGVLLVALGSICLVLDIVPGITASGPGLGFDFDLGLVGIGVGIAGLLGYRTGSPSRATIPSDERQPIHVTRPLLETLLRSAVRSEPESISLGLRTTPAGRLSGVDDVADATPVFTHRFLPTRPNSVSSVFGVDLQTPPRRTHGRFVSHPRSALRLTRRDDLHEIVFIAVPPWDEASVAVFDRNGRRHPLRVVDAVPPTGSVPDVER